MWQREKGLWVLHATQMPAVLIETGFVANYDDERYLNSEKGQEEIAQAITDALVKYRKMVETPKTLANTNGDNQHCKIKPIFYAVIHRDLLSPNESF